MRVRVVRFTNRREVILSPPRREGSHVHLTRDSTLSQPRTAGPGFAPEGRNTTSGPATLPTFDCLVLSGGGAKGAYGAGVAKALAAYRQLKDVRGSVCYIGASAGALNAYVLAMANADELISSWLGAPRRNILGHRFPSATLRAMLRVATKPFSIYSNVGLQKLIERSACIKRIKSPLIIAATDYTRGNLKAFYVSKLIDK